MGYTQTNRAWLACDQCPHSRQHREATIAPNLRSYGAVLARRWSVMLPALLLVPAVALLLSLGQQKIYAANSQVLLSHTNPAATLNGLTDPNAALAPDRIISTQAAVARDPLVAQQALSLSHVPSTPQAFLNRSSVSTLTNADLLEFSVSDPNPAVAARLATNYAKAYIAYRGQLDSQAIDAALAGIAQRLDQLARAGQTGTPTQTALLHEQQALTATQAAGTNDAQLVQPAQLGSQIAPRPSRSAAIGVGLGIALALGLAFLMEALDRRVESAEEMERRLGLPLLARIPAPAPWRGVSDRLATLRDFIRELGRRAPVAPAPPRTPAPAPASRARRRAPNGRFLPEPSPPPESSTNASSPPPREWLATVRDLGGAVGRARPVITSKTAAPRRHRGADSLVALRDQNGRQAEAFRVLKSSLDFASLEHDFKSIVVTSGREYKGKATTIANLGVTLALSGRRVLLCDLDGRTPAIGDLFGLQGHPGVTDVVLGHAGLDEAIASISVPSPFSWPRTVEVSKTPENGSAKETAFLRNKQAFLGVLSFGGGLRPNSGFLGSRAVTSLLEELQQTDVDLVLIDTPALLAYGEARTLSARVDAVIVALAPPVRAPLLDELARTLSRSPALPLGFITVGAFSDGGYGVGSPSYGLEQHSPSGGPRGGHLSVRHGSSPR
jgi:Mrp family chromosome partitioning ATPase/capsular polysaccharide biosynthesis protein